MMDDKFIKKIQETSGIPEWIKAIERLDLNNPGIVLPNDYKVFSLEKFLENPLHYKLGFETTVIGDFIAYCLKFVEDGSTCFVDPNNMQAKTIFDLGTEVKPKNKFHVARLFLQPLAGFKKLLSLDGANLSQKEAAEFVEDWSDNLDIVGLNGNHLTTLTAIRAFREMTIDSAKKQTNEVNHFGESMSSMEKVEAAQQELIPLGISFSITPYLGFKEYKFKIRVSIRTDSDNPKIVFRVMHFESVDEEIAMEFKEIIREGFKDNKLSCYLGTASW